MQQQLVLAVVVDLSRLLVILVHCADLVSSHCFIVWEEPELLIYKRRCGFAAIRNVDLVPRTKF